VKIDTFLECNFEWFINKVTREYDVVQRLVNIESLK